jgi:hypothetical protein
MVLDQMITIPGTPMKIGLDPIMGLLPIGGDVLGVVLSGYIIFESARLGISRATLGRMVLNVIIDGLVGVIPVLGDFFDFAWSANTYNIQLLEESLKSPSQKNIADRWFILSILIGLLLLTIVLITVPVILINIVWRALTGG